LLPSRNGSEVTGFDPVFKPYAPDPPRNLPRVIRAGVVVPPVPSHSAQQNVSAKSPRGTGRETSASINHVSDNGEGGINTIALGVAIGSIFIGVVFCVSYKLLPARRSPKLPWQKLAQKVSKSVPKKLMLREMASFSHILEDCTVCLLIQGSFRV
jgi:hypothetical protein